jgi:hypothetical protein
MLPDAVTVTASAGTDRDRNRDSRPGVTSLGGGLEPGPGLQVRFGP